VVHSPAKALSGPFACKSIEWSIRKQATQFSKSDINKTHLATFLQLIFTQQFLLDH